MWNSVATQWIVSMIRYKRFTLGDFWFAGNYLQHRNTLDPIEKIQKAFHQVQEEVIDAVGLQQIQEIVPPYGGQNGRCIACSRPNTLIELYKNWLNWILEGPKNIPALQYTKIYAELIAVKVLGALQIFWPLPLDTPIGIFLTDSGLDCCGPLWWFKWAKVQCTDAAWSRPHPSPLPRQGQMLAHPECAFEELSCKPLCFSHKTL